MAVAQMQRQEYTLHLMADMLNNAL